MGCVWAKITFSVLDPERDCCKTLIIPVTCHLREIKTSLTRHALLHNVTQIIIPNINQYEKYIHNPTCYSYPATAPSLPFSLTGMLISYLRETHAPNLLLLVLARKQEMMY